MADVQLMSSLIYEDSIIVNGEKKYVTVHPNARAGGYYSGISTIFTDTYLYNLSEAERTGCNGKYGFDRIMMPGTDALVNGKNNTDALNRWAIDLNHEFGHYVFGFLDEYMNGDRTPWGADANRMQNMPLNFGLMDSASADHEMSKAFDYDYLNGTSVTKYNTTNQYYFHRLSCEDNLKELLTSTERVGGYNLKVKPEAISDDYGAEYTKMRKDATAIYPNAIPTIMSIFNTGA